MSEQKSRKHYENEVRSWGYSHVFTWTDGPNAYYSPHAHPGPTTHLILRGELTIAYPGDARPGETTTRHGVGDRIDVEAGRVHEVYVGREGCTYVIGE